MASLSLPRVLQLKKNSLDAEREHFEKFQTLAIQKAVSSVETPVKEKHVRSTIIGTFQEQSAITYWMVAIRLPLQDNRIVAWKFCHLTHKLLREGHPACLDDSQRHIGMIENLGKLWVHLREGYGKLVHLYCTLLVCKLRFHSRNPRFPGNMNLTADELDAIAENDVNNYFQLCVELFDYMDDILTLQAAVFDSLGNARANSMTASGQCRLAALIPCAQDSSQIYDCNVRLLFRLHASLPADTLSGHRERFRQQFKKLSSFYKHASSLQYYRNLLTLPVLPSNPPNFLQQSDFGTYVTPVVSIPEPAPDELDSVGSLVDTSDTISQFSQPTSPDQFDAFDARTTPSPQPDPVVERDRLIDHLQIELKRMRSEVSQMVQDRNNMVSSMREHCAKLESELQTTKTDLVEERHKAELLSVQTPEIQQKLSQTEEKAKVMDDKFQKLKSAYSSLREEHINLIRQKAEVDKLSASLRAAAAEHESAKMALQQQLHDQMKDVELLQQSASSSEEIEAYKNEIANLRTDIEHARQKEVQLETLRAAMEALEIEHKTATTESEEKLNIVNTELKEVKETLDIIRKEKEEKEVELKRVKEELVGLRKSTGEENAKVIEERDKALQKVTELTEKFEQNKQGHETRITDLQADLTTKQLKLTDLEANLIIVRQDHADEKSRLQDEVFELLKYKKDFESVSKVLETEREDNSSKLNDMTIDKERFEAEVIRKNIDIATLQSKITELEENNQKHTNMLAEIQLNTNDQIKELKDAIVIKQNEISDLQNNIAKLNEMKQKLDSNCESFSNTVSVLQATVEAKDIEIKVLTDKIADNKSANEKQKTDLETKVIKYQEEIKTIKDKLESQLVEKDQIINDLKRIQSEKDQQIVILGDEAQAIGDEVSKLEEDLSEKEAELEITKNELLNLKEEHERIIGRNDDNTAMKNKDLRELNEKVNYLSKEKSHLLSEKETIISNFKTEKQVYENKIKDMETEITKLQSEYKTIEVLKQEVESNLQHDLQILKSDYDELKTNTEAKIQELNDRVLENEKSYKDQIGERDETIKEIESVLIKLKDELNELTKAKEVEKLKLEASVAEKENDKQMMESRLFHVEKEKLTAECELQDLLQHNTTLEVSVADLKQQLENAKNEALKQRQSVVSCAGSAALEVTLAALASLDRGNTQDSSRAAADVAAKAFEELARHKEASSDVESVARCAILAAHNAAQLSSYVTEVSNVSTDIELSDKLTKECRNVLTTTRQCMESLKAGNLPSSPDASKQIRSLLNATAAADKSISGVRSVDDELADMDRAIEEAAGQIESLLAASRAGDSGVKLEVNAKILDACTTLMGAVKILVQDARRLQNELGDPTTRQKLYRKNPQWSEGLISAAKAVVFAAKLLVTSADEAVGASGRVEGVSAAAHEVAGSTAQLVAASRARAPPAAPALARLTQASRSVAAATGAVVAAVRAASALVNEQEALDTSALSLTATRRLEMESKVRALELESALDNERARLAALRRRHYALAQDEENGGITNGKE